MRNRFADTFFDLGKADQRLCCIVADISPAGSIAKFREEFPERFVNTGVAEQIMIGMAAGMAQRDLRPFCYTIATFALYRPFEFIRVDLAYQNLPVTVVGIGGGVSYSTLGATHHALEDIQVATAIPNLSVIAPCDPDEVEAATRWCATQEHGPVYLRLGRAGEPNLTQPHLEPWQFGKLRYLSRGEDVCILTYGAIASVAAEVANWLAEQGESVSFVSCHTLKPLDVDGIARALDSHSTTIVIEETGGQAALGEWVKAIAFEAGLEKGYDMQLHTFSLADEFKHVYGSHADILAAHGLSRDSIIEKLRDHGF